MPAFLHRIVTRASAPGMLAALPATSMMLMLVKATYLSPALAEQGLVALSVRLLWNDLPALGTVLVLSIFPHFTRLSLLRVIITATGVCAVVFQFIDAVLVVSLNARISVRELGEYFLEGMVSTGMIWLALAVFALAFLLTVSPRLNMRPARALIGLLFGVVLCLLPPTGPAWISRNYGTAISGERDPLLVGSVARTDPNPSPVSEQAFPKPPAEEVIIIMVESLTAADSHRISGLRNLLPEFDEISKQGALFINYFSNHQVTEGGLVALLMGRAPIVSSGVSSSLYQRFSGCGSVAAALKRFGYHLSYMSAAPIGFRGASGFIRRIGFDRLRELGRERRFSSLRTDSFWAVPDHVLFEETLKTVNKLQRQGKPYLLFLETESTHRPYTHPLGLADTEEEIWRYADHSLAQFLRQLQSTGFMDRGLVIVTGDHRKMLPIPPAELKRYGDAAAWRVPLLLLGKGVKKGIVDERVMQAADLFRLLPAALQPEAPLSSHAFLVRRYFPPLIRENRQGLIVVDRLLNQYGATIHGGQTVWESAVPPDAAVAEAELREAASFSDGCRATEG